jgi:CRP/FNR family transcriptional regulator, cyclic AMP receptor protein
MKLLNFLGAANFPAAANTALSSLEAIAQNRIGITLKELRKNKTLVSQGSPCLFVSYVRAGSLKRSIMTPNGRESVVAILGAGDFIGEECLTDRPICTASATALTDCSILQIEKSEFVHLLHSEQTVCDQFITYLVMRKNRAEESLMDLQLNSGEKRLARTLLLLAEQVKEGSDDSRIPKVSQETLAEMIGTSRSRVNIFMNKFRKLGLIQYDGSIHVDTNRLSRLLRDQ